MERNSFYTPGNKSLASYSSRAFTSQDKCRSKWAVWSACPAPQLMFALSPETFQRSLLTCTRDSALQAANV
jgi:hypothetical protein